MTKITNVLTFSYSAAWKIGDQLFVLMMQNVIFNSFPIFSLPPSPRPFPQHFLPRWKCEQLVRQGILEHVLSWPCAEAPLGFPVVWGAATQRNVLHVHLHPHLFDFKGSLQKFFKITRSIIWQRSGLLFFCTGFILFVINCKLCL